MMKEENPWPELTIDDAIGATHVLSHYVALYENT